MNSEVCPSLVNGGGGNDCLLVMHFQAPLANTVACPCFQRPALSSPSAHLLYPASQIGDRRPWSSLQWSQLHCTFHFTALLFTVHTSCKSYPLCSVLPAKEGPDPSHQRSQAFATPHPHPRPAQTGERESKGPKLSETYLNISLGRRDPSAGDDGEEANRRAGMTLQCQVTGQHSSAIFTRSLDTGSSSEVAK